MRKKWHFVEYVLIRGGRIGTEIRWRQERRKPLWRGEQLALWPIFNVADASIFAGVALILLFQKRFFGKKVGEDSAEEKSSEDLVAEAVVSESTEEGKAS